MKGRIHSFQSMGAVDGPGVRFVVFLQGCPLRCVYCHNPDTWEAGGEEYSVDDVVRRILRCRSYFGEDGGVTVSGGEPLMQWEFVSELFRKLKEEGIHTALDTSGTGDPDGAAEVLKYTDLVLCDLKFSSEEDYSRYCGGSLGQVLSFLELTGRLDIPLWIRHVVVPGLTDGKENLDRIAELARHCPNLRRIELLPFRKICSVKYEAMGVPFPLAGYEECTEEAIQKWNKLITLRV